MYVMWISLIQPKVTLLTNARAGGATFICLVPYQVEP